MLTLGTFDGVHIGHQTIIKQLNETAKKIDGESILLTFSPHPRVTLNKGVDSLKLLNTLEEKTKLLEHYGLQNLIIHPFTIEFSKLSAEAFIQLLVKEVKIHSMIIGYDHHFGHGREGDYEHLVQYAKKYNFDCIKIEEVKSEGHHISSTEIRNALLGGDLDLAERGLGRNYRLSGKVINGDKLGRTLGFPTANLQVEKFKLIPGNGVYFVKVIIKNETFKGLLSIGTRPTILEKGEKRVEVYILDFDKDIYGQEITLEFIQKIRDDIKFNSVEELIEQMNKDKEVAERTRLS